MRSVLLTFVLLLACACELPGPGSGTSSVNARQSNNGCFATPEGTGAAGDGCRTFRDCQEFCCPCSTGTKKFSGAACIDDRCGAQATACAKAETNSTGVCP
jgi:hypothetical protein